MHEDFWRDRWARGLIGFHEGAVNVYLRKYVARLSKDPASGPARVLVPLCGKAVDLAFLAEKGLDVTGVELVKDAAEAFFREHSLAPAAEPWHVFESLAAGGVRIAVGNFFGLSLAGPDRFDFAYDRAALIAMRPEDRERYVTTLVAALEPGARILLVTFQLEGGTYSGPPFSVGEADVRRLFATCLIEKLEEKDITDTEPRFRERGATRTVEHAWLVTTP